MAERRTEGSAKIIAFPGTGSRRRDERDGRKRRVDDAPSPQMSASVCDSGWYHDAAIRDEDDTRKR
jgi:hypothetical protein